MFFPPHVRAARFTPLAPPICLRSSCLVDFFVSCGRKRREKRRKNRAEVLSSQSEGLISVWNINKDCFSFVFLFERQASARYIGQCKDAAEKTDMKKEMHQLQLTKQCPLNAVLSQPAWVSVHELQSPLLSHLSCCSLHLSSFVQPTCVFKAIFKQKKHFSNGIKQLTLEAAHSISCGSADF